MDDIHENDVVALLIDQPGSDLHRGDVGTVIQVFESTNDHPAGYTIEFVDETGKVKTEAHVTDYSQIVKLRLNLGLEAA